MSVIEVRDEGGTGPIVLTSYASVFNSPYKIRGGAYHFTERVLPGAFTTTLAQRPDVVFRLEHSGPPLARTTNGTLTLAQDAMGLRYEARLDRSDPDVQSLVPKVRSGAYSESSFAFRCIRDSWSDDRSERSMIELDLDRGDVSAVTFGASPATGQHMTMSRAAEADMERRAWAEAISRSGHGGPGWDSRCALWTPSDLDRFLDGGDDEANAQSHPRYTAEQITALGKRGLALRNPDGSFSYPICNEQDLKDAIRAAARGQKSSAERIRVWIRSRALALGLTHLIPSQWHHDGTSATSPRSAPLPASRIGEFERELAAITPYGARR